MKAKKYLTYKRKIACNTDAPRESSKHDARGISLSVVDVKLSFLVSLRKITRNSGGIVKARLYRRFVFVVACALIMISGRSAFAQAQSCAPLPNGTVSWWRAEGSATDVKNRNNGTLQNGATFASGKVGQSFSFDGVDDYVQLPDNFFPVPSSGTANVPFSFEAWFKTTSGGVIFGQQAFAPFNAAAGAIPGIYVGTDGKLYVQMFWSGTVEPAVSPAVINDGVFHHVGVTYDGTTQRVYLDGALIASKAFTQVGYSGTYKY